MILSVTICHVLEYYLHFSQHESFEVFLIGPELIPISPREINNKIRNVINLNLLLVLWLGFD